MNRAILRFELHRLFRQPLWPFVLGFVVIILLPPAFSTTAPLIGAPLIGAFFLGAMRIWGHWKGADFTVTESEYVLSRTGTRTELLVARWASYLLPAAILWGCLAIALAGVGAFSAHSRVSVDWQTVSAFENAGYRPVFSSPMERERMERWVNEGRPLTVVRGLPMSGGRVDVEVPWMSVRVLALAFVVFLLGLVSQTVEPPRSGSLWQLLREPMQYLKWGPYAAVLFFAIVWPIVLIRSMAMQERLVAVAYLHAGVAVAIGLALVALYAALALRSWRRADL